MRIVAFCNVRGGAGKSTFLRHLAAACAREHGLRALVVDADPQRNATFHCLEPSQRQAGLKRRAEVGPIRLAMRGEPAPDLAESLISSPGFGFDLLPGDTSLLEALPALEAAWSRGDAQAILALRRMLKSLSGRYDLAFLDLAPGLTGLARTGLAAADGFVSTFGATLRSLDDLRVSKEWLLNWEPRWREILGAGRRGEVRARFLGALANRVEPESPVHRAMIEGAGRLSLAMARQLGDHQLGARYILGAAPIFPAETIARAQAAKRPVFHPEVAPETYEIFARASRRLLANLDGFSQSPAPPLAALGQGGIGA